MWDVSGCDWLVAEEMSGLVHGLARNCPGQSFVPGWKLRVSETCSLSQCLAKGVSVTKQLMSILCLLMVLSFFSFFPMTSLALL